MGVKLDPEKSLLSQTHGTVGRVEKISESCFDDLKSDLIRAFDIYGVQLKENDENVEIRVPRLRADEGVAWFVFGWMVSRHIKWISFG